MCAKYGDIVPCILNIVYLYRITFFLSPSKESQILQQPVFHNQTRSKRFPLVSIRGLILTNVAVAEGWRREPPSEELEIRIAGESAASTAEAAAQVT